MNFQYVAYTGDWKVVKGAIDVDSEKAAEQALIKQGYQPISIKTASSMPALDQLFPSLFKIKTKDITMFSRQLSTLLEAGISLVPGLQMIQQQITNRLFKKIVITILDDLRAGSSFSDALIKHTSVFGDLYCKLVAVGEQTGSLELSLKQAANYIEKQTIAKKKVKRAMTYPVIVLAVAAVVMVVMVIFVLPSMITMFSSMDAELPAVTKLLIGLLGFTDKYKVFLLIGIIAIIFVGILSLKQPPVRYQVDKWMLTVPVLGPVNLMNEMARFSQTIALLLHAGLPLPDIIDMTRQITNNRVLQDALGKVQRDLVQGEGLSGPMTKHKLFPPLLVQMVMVGEESGNLESTLSVVANSYETEADDRLSGLIALIEPAMTIGLALMVAFIALAVITPMYSIMGSVN